MSEPMKMVDGVAVPLTAADIDARAADEAAAASSARYVPVSVVRERLEADGRWSAAAAALLTDPAMMLKVLTLREGIASDDAQAVAWLTAIGADPAAVLAA